MPSPRSRSARWAIRDGLIVAGLLFAAYLFLVVAPAAGTVGFDAFAYWRLDLEDPYATATGGFGAFTYTPLAARAFAAAALLDWPSFLWLWEALLAATVAWLGIARGPVGVLAILAFPPVALELYHGNVHLLMAAAIALGFRYPAAWAFLLLTKVTPGIGVLWFAVRREWQAFATALGVTAALAAASLAIDGRLWADWIDSVTRTATGAVPLGQAEIPIPLWLRLPAAAVLVAWGGRHDRRCTVPVASTLALPVLWPSGLAVLAGLWRLESTVAGARATSRLVP